MPEVRTKKSRAIGNCKEGPKGRKRYLDTTSRAAVILMGAIVLGAVSFRIDLATVICSDGSVSRASETFKLTDSAYAASRVCGTQF